MLAVEESKPQGDLRNLATLPSGVGGAPASLVAATNKRVGRQSWKHSHVTEGFTDSHREGRALRAAEAATVAEGTAVVAFLVMSSENVAIATNVATAHCSASYCQGYFLGPHRSRDRVK